MTIRTSSSFKFSLGALRTISKITFLTVPPTCRFIAFDACSHIGLPNCLMPIETVSSIEPSWPARHTDGILTIFTFTNKPILHPIYPLKPTVISTHLQSRHPNKAAMVVWALIVFLMGLEFALPSVPPVTAAHTQHI
jgi:hypothetical protein